MNIQEWINAGKPSNTIINGDCLEGLRQMASESVDLVVTDPPYNTGMQEVSGKAWLPHFFDDNLTEEDYSGLVKNVCFELFRVLKKNKGIYIYINWKMLGKWKQELENVGFTVKNVIVWDKVVHGLNYQNYAYTYELIIFAVKNDFFPNNKVIRDDYYKDVWHIRRNLNNEDISEHHETVKQIKVVRLPILHGSKENELVLDPFMGTGTTAVACKQTGRQFIGFEISLGYCKTAEERLAQENLWRFF